MTPADFAQANKTFYRPDGWDESQCGEVRAFVGMLEQCNLEGAPVIVTCWQPDEEDRRKIAAGEPIFVSFITGELPPHFVCTEFPYNPAEPSEPPKPQ